MSRCYWENRLGSLVLIVKSPLDSRFTCKFNNTLLNARLTNTKYNPQLFF